MEEKYIFEGKTSTEAIEKGLKELGVKRNEVDVFPIKEEKRSFFNILESRVVKVELKIKENTKKEEKTVIEKQKKELSNEDIKKAKENISNFLTVFLKQFSQEDIEISIFEDKYYIYVDLKGEKTNALIGYRGETLNALQNLLTAVASKGVEEKIRVILDISGYREKRKKVLEELAEKVAKKVVKTRKKATLEPMSAYERKIIHSVLQKNNKVTTESIGEEPNRKIVVLLKK